MRKASGGVAARRAGDRPLRPGGKLIVADLSFQSRSAMDAFAESIPDLWEAEPYWLVEDSLPALEKVGLQVSYEQVSACAGVYTIWA